jgi:hypothetical protein
MKLDLASQREIPIEEGLKLTELREMPFLEVSSLKNINVDEAMKLLKDSMI